MNRSLVLDSGCGYGYGSRYLADKGADFVVGTDKDPNCIRSAKNWYQTGNLDFVIADSNYLPLRSNTFDVTASLEVIEHIKNYEGYLREIKRVLNDEGTLVLSTPNKHHTDRTRLMPLYHFIEFYPSTLLSLLGRYFVVLHLYGKSIAMSSSSLLTPTIGIRLRFAIAKVGSIALVRSVLRKMPGQVLHVLRLLLNTSYVPQLTTEDFKISKSNVDRASNLIVVCRKVNR